MATKNYFGLDLTSSEQKTSACVTIDDNIRIIKAALIYSDIDIISLIKQLQPAVIAIDAPLSLPAGLCCLDEECNCKPLYEYQGRWSEQMLAKQGIPCYFTTKKSIIKNMVKRAIELRKALEKQRFHVIEVYPYASKTIIFGKLKPKTTSSGIRQLRKKLGELFNSNNIINNSWNHDLCDAAVAAYTGLLYGKGLVKAVGNSSEGFIYIPNNSYGQVKNG